MPDSPNSIAILGFSIDTGVWRISLISYKYIVTLLHACYNYHYSLFRNNQKHKKYIFRFLWFMLVIGNSNQVIVYKFRQYVCLFTYEHLFGLDSAFTRFSPSKHNSCGQF